MKATFVLTPAEARRLIAKAVVQTPEFQKAWKDAYVLLAGGTTNAFIAQELGYDVEPGQCTVGISCAGLLCVTEPSSRKSFPNVFYKGQPVDKKIDEALQDYHADTVIIKGANASLAVFSAGITLSAVKIDINFQAVLGSIMKMVMMPAVILIMGLIFHMDPLNLKMLVVAAALPPAFSGIIIADEYDTYVATGTTSLTLSVILFVGFCPLWLWITDLCTHTVGF